MCFHEYLYKPFFHKCTLNPCACAQDNSVVTLVADEQRRQRSWLCIKALANYIRQPDGNQPRLSYNHDPADNDQWTSGLLKSDDQWIGQFTFKGQHVVVTTEHLIWEINAAAHWLFIVSKTSDNTCPFSQWQYYGAGALLCSRTVFTAPLANRIRM